MQKTVVVLGGNQMACPAIEKIQQRGFHVIAVDGNSNAPASEIADRFVHQNFSDAAATTAALADVRFDGVIPLNDFAIRSAAHVARERGLPGWNEFAERCFSSKVAMKRCWIESGLSTARCVFSTVTKLKAGKIPEWETWPAVVKPAFSGGGSRGVFVAWDWHEVRARLGQVETCYLDGEVLIEEFIKGTEHTLEVLVCRGEPTLLSISDKKNYPGNATVVQTLYFPGPIGNSHRQKLERLVFAACRSMGLTDGTTHYEILISNDQPYLLEVGGARAVASISIPSARSLRATIIRDYSRRSLPAANPISDGGLRSIWSGTIFRGEREFFVASTASNGLKTNPMSWTPLSMRRSVSLVSISAMIWRDLDTCLFDQSRPPKRESAPRTSSGP